MKKTTKKVSAAHKKTATPRKRTTRKKPADAETGTTTTELTAEAAPGVAAKRGRRDSKSRKRAPQAGEVGAAVALEAGAPGAAATAPAQVEESESEIVIRFPPAAPPPFDFLPKPGEAAARAPVVTAAEPPPEQAAAPPAPPPAPVLGPPPGPTARMAPAAPPREAGFRGPPPRDRGAPERQGMDRRDGRDRGRHDDRRGRDRRMPEQRDGGFRVPAAPPPAPRREPPAPGPGGETMSASKKRRLRRRRRHQSGTDVATARPPGPPPAARSDGRPPAAESAAAPVDEEVQPWLDAADSIRAGLSQPAPPPEAFAEAEEAEAVAEAPPLAEPAAAGPPAAEEAPAREVGRRRRRRGRRDRREVAEPEAVPAVELEEAAPAAGPAREMIINAIPREECRIAILAGGRLEEIYLERAAVENHVGNIYKGLVTNVEPSIQAAFIDFGQGKNGFLHISDLHPQYFPDGAGATENVGHKLPRKNRPPIQRCLRRNQEVIVQVTKEGIGTKGPTLSTYISIPGRFLVMMPGMGRLGVSRRIDDDQSRDKLRSVLSELQLPEGMGFIARTAALDRTKRELQGDLTYLTRLWRAVEQRMKNDPAPAELYRESDLVIRTIRDVFTSDISRILVDDADVAERARDFLSIFSPRSSDLVAAYTDPEPVFHRFGIEAELERLHSRRVPLRSGGSLVIEPTEALVAIDVNSGRFRTEDDAEATAYKINVEAADEIARQLRLRDLGGVVVCDFIDMRMESHRRDIERRLNRNLKEHKERVKVLRMSEFGIIELTRQRQRASLTRSVYQDCRHCRGTGLVKTVDSVALDVMRLIQLAVTREHIHTVEVSISPEVAYLLQNRKRRLLYELESKNRRIISLRPDPNFSLDQVEIRCTDARGRLVPHM